MNILFITPLYLFPPYWGGGRRTYNLIKYLAKKHKIYLVSPFYPQFENAKINHHKEILKKMGVEILAPKPLIKVEHPFTKHINPEVILKCIEILLFKKIDVIICDYPWSGINLLIANFFFNKPFIFHEHNIEFKIKDEIRAKYGNLMRILELILCKKARKIVTVCKKDKEILIKEFGINPKKIEIVENGFEDETFFPNEKKGKLIRKKLGLENNPIVLFFGKLDYPPNKEAVYKIRWEILPRVISEIPNVKFLIVGKKYKFEFQHEAIIFTGLVDNVEDYINAADVVIVPLLAGGGTRIKILEAIACGKIVISTRKGAEGLINKLTKPFLRIADDWNLFSEYIVQELRNREKKTLKVPEEFIKKYSWRKAGETLEKILRKISKQS